MGLFRKFRSFTAEWGWEEIVPASGSEPSGERSNALFARAGSGVFVLLGGRTSASVDRSDLWTYSLTSGTWTQVVASGLTNVALPAGYADSSGNLFVAQSNRFDLFSASTTLSKISVTTGTQTSLTDSGTGAATGTAAQLTVDIANKKVFSGRVDAFTYQSGVALTSATQDAVANTSSKVAYTSANTGRLASGSFGFYPAGNALYMLAPSIGYAGGSWTLNTSSIFKYDLTSGTGWAQESGVTNIAGAVSMPAWPTNGNQFLWSATENKFFVFVSGSTANCARVLSYDPTTKTISDVVFSGSPPSYILGAEDGYGLGRGNCGTAVETNGTFYFCTCGPSTVTNARIWKFRRN